MEDALKGGHLAFLLEGKKLRGGFALTRTSRGWILVKKRDGEVREGVNLEEEAPESVLSGLTVEEVAARARASQEVD